MEFFPLENESEHAEKYNLKLALGRNMPVFIDATGWESILCKVMRCSDGIEVLGEIEDQILDGYCILDREYLSNLLDNGSTIVEYIFQQGHSNVANRLTSSKLVSTKALWLKEVDSQTLKLERPKSGGRPGPGVSDYEPMSSAQESGESGFRQETLLTMIGILSALVISADIKSGNSKGKYAKQNGRPSVKVLQKTIQSVADKKHFGKSGFGDSTLSAIFKKSFESVVDEVTVEKLLEVIEEK